jgi:DNA-binding transcriptional ArsR family regulator
MDDLATSDRSAVPRRSARSELSEGSAERISEWLRAIAEPTRMRLIGLLNEGSMSVQALAAAVGASTQNVSRHLMTLHRAGIVGRRKDGTWVHYELVDWTGWWLIQQVDSAISDARRD